MSNDRINELPIAPLRAILSRRFVAYVGTEVTLACGHMIYVRPRRANRHRSIRCEACAFASLSKARAQ
jgi:hypothetical protein